MENHTYEATLAATQDAVNARSRLRGTGQSMRFYAHKVDKESGIHVMICPGDPYVVTATLDTPGMLTALLYPQPAADLREAREIVRQTFHELTTKEA